MPGVRGEAESHWMTTLLRVGMGLFFLVVGILKVGQVGDTANFIMRSDVLPEWCSMPLACLGIAMELVVAVCLLFKWHYRGAALWGTVMCGVFVFFYVQGWVRGLELSCNCLGTAHEIVNYPADTVLRIMLLGAMLLLYWDAQRSAFALPHGRRFHFPD